MLDESKYWCDALKKHFNRKLVIVKQDVGFVIMFILIMML